MNRLLFALALLLPIGAHAETIQYGPPTNVGGSAPCTTFGSTAGKCFEGVGGILGGNLGINVAPAAVNLSIKGAGTTTGLSFQTTDSGGTPLIKMNDYGDLMLQGGVANHAFISIGPVAPAAPNPEISMGMAWATTGNAHGITDASTFSNTSSDSSYNSYDAWAKLFSNSPTAGSHYAGFQNRAEFEVGSFFDEGRMFISQPALLGGHINTLMGFISQPNPQVDQVADTYYGFRAEQSQFIGRHTATTSWAFYADFDPSYFGAGVGFGTAITGTVSAPIGTIQVGADGGGGTPLLAVGGSVTTLTTGRPTNDNPQILLGRTTAANSGGIEWINSPTSNGYGFRLTATGFTDPITSTNNGFQLYGRANNVLWTEIAHFEPNGQTYLAMPGGAGIGVGIATALAGVIATPIGVLQVGPDGGGGIAKMSVGGSVTDLTIGRPTNDNPQIILGRCTAANCGGIEWATSSATNGTGWRMTSTGFTDPTTSTNNGLEIWGRNNNVAWTEVAHFDLTGNTFLAMNGGGVVVGTFATPPSGGLQVAGATVLGGTLKAAALDTTCTSKPTGTIALIGAPGTGSLTVCP